MLTVGRSVRPIYRLQPRGHRRRRDSSRTRARPRSAAATSPQRRSIASANAVTSPGSTSPSCSTSSGNAPIRLATTGTPAAIASAAAIPNVSAEREGTIARAAPFAGVPAPHRPHVRQSANRDAPRARGGHRPFLQTLLEGPPVRTTLPVRKSPPVQTGPPGSAAASRSFAKTAAWEEPNLGCPARASRFAPFRTIPGHHQRDARHLARLDRHVDSLLRGESRHNQRIAA